MPRKKKVTPVEVFRAPTPDEWVNDRPKRNRLAALLNDPVMREAMLTLDATYAAQVPAYIAIDGTPTSLPTAVDLNNILALRHIHRAGFFGYVNGLKNLTRERTIRRSDKAPWGDLLPDKDPE